MNLPFNLSFGFRWKKSIQGDEIRNTIKNKDNTQVLSSAPFISVGKDIKAGGDIVIGNTVHHYGVQPKVDKQLAQELVVFLENKRVLYVQHAWEVPAECVDSVMDMRRYITDKIHDTGEGELKTNLTDIRRACIKFLSICTNDGDRHRDMRHLPRNEFECNLSDFRQSVSNVILPLIIKHQLTVEPDLLQGLKEEK